MNAESRIRELVQASLADNHRVDSIRFVNELFLVAAEVGTVKCWQEDGRQLCFQIDGQPAWKMELERAKAKLRLLCARLAAVCTEKAGRDVSVYGDEVSLKVCNSQPAHAETVCCTTKMHVRFQNTMDEQGFVIETT